MLGSNQDIDASFMDALPFSARDAALELIRFSSLKAMLEMQQNGPNEFMQNKFPLTQQQWNQVLNTVMLTKVSYFQITPELPNAYIDKLIEIAAFAFGKKGANARELAQAMVKHHPLFAKWLQNCIRVKEQKAQMAKHHK